MLDAICTTKAFGSKEKSGWDGVVWCGVAWVDMSTAQLGEREREDVSLLGFVCFRESQTWWKGGTEKVTSLRSEVEHSSHCSATSQPSMVLSPTLTEK